MGMSYASDIQAAGKYLISKLLESNSLPYSTFYNGTDETHERLWQDMVLDSDWSCPESLIDYAVTQLDQQGVVNVETFTELLSDGENDYLITLTQNGREKILSGFEPAYRDME